MNFITSKLPLSFRKYLQLFALLLAFTLSYAFRTLPAVLAPGISQQFDLSIQAIGYFAAAFHFSFGAMQLFVGVAIDRFGPERTVGTMFVFAVLGTALSYFATSFLVLLIGQILIGIGCAPAFLGCLVFISKHFAPERFAALSGLVLGLGGIGMLITATPLALVAEAWSWRGAFVILSFAGVFATAACFALVDDRSSPGVPAESVFQSVCLVGVLLKRRGTAGILLLGSVCYASVLTFRGLWIVPFLSERHSLSLVQSSNVVFVLSISMIISPFFFGFVDPGGRNRRLLIVASAVAMAIATLWLGFAYTESLGMSVIVITLIGVISGFTILQYADVRSSYEPAVIGRALSLLNMSTFIGVAVVQSIVATVGDFAILAGANAIEWIFSSLTILLVSGCIGFCLLPSPSSQIEKVEN